MTDDTIDMTGSKNNNNSNSNSSVSKGSKTKSKKDKKDKKEKKKKKKKTGMMTKWTYVLLDKERNSFVSLCRGQMNLIQMSQWMTSLYNECNFGENSPFPRLNGPDSNYIGWYTEPKCSCTISGASQEKDFIDVGFPKWLQSMTSEVMNVCNNNGGSSGKKAKKLFEKPPNCCEIFYFKNSEKFGWQWHSDRDLALFAEQKKQKLLEKAGKDEQSTGSKKKKKGSDWHVNTSIHMVVGRKRMFKLCPRKPNSDDKEKSIYVLNGDIMLCSGMFDSQYLSMIATESKDEKGEKSGESGSESESVDRKDANDKKDATFYVVWRWISYHFDECKKKMQN